MVGVALGPGPAGPSAVVAERVARVRSILGGRGGVPVGEPEIGFLSRGRLRTHSIELNGAGCYAIWAVGVPQATDIDLFVHAPEGILLGEDTERHPYPSVRVCPSSAGRVHAVVRMYEGRGEYAVGVTRVPPEASVELARAFGEGGDATHSVPPILGPANARPVSIDDAVAAVEAAITQRGWSRTEPWRRGRRLRTGEEETIAVPARTFPTCVLVAAVGDAGVRDLDLFLLDGAGRVVDRDDAPDPRPTVRACGEAPVPYRVRVRMYAGEGEYRWALFSMGQPLPAGVPSPRPFRLGIAEATARWGALGFHPVGPLVRGGLTAGSIQSRRQAVRAGSCYVAGGVTEAGRGQGADLDLTVYGGDGAAIGADLQTDDHPTVRFCAARTEEVRLEYREYGASSQYLSFVFESP